MYEQSCYEIWQQSITCPINPLELSNKVCEMHFYILLSIYSTENIVLGSNFWNGDFDGFTCFEDIESENHISSKWSLCVSVISITQK